MVEKERKERKEGRTGESQTVSIRTALEMGQDSNACCFMEKPGHLCITGFKTLVYMHMMQVAEMMKMNGSIHIGQKGCWQESILK